MIGRLFCLICALVIVPVWCSAQCGLQDSFYIPDQSSENFIIEVNGLAINDLAAPSQGVCGVTLHFEHDGVGDWVVLLTSPAGQQIRLVGPSGLFGQTNGSSWDVTFVPCTDMAAPDLGFLPTWQSDQAWGNFSTFGGSYYPNIGCLEDFNTGPVNGPWTLFIEDFNELDVGLLLSFSITFCDNSGSLTCLLCEARGGHLRHPEIIACENDDLLEFDPDVVFPLGQSDTDNYSYTYLTVSNDIIVQQEPSPDLRSNPPGLYTVCGLSYQKSDSTDLPMIGDTFSQFSDSLSSPSPPLCGELSDNCIRVEIIAIPDTVFIQDMICKGSSYRIADSVFTTSGLKTINTLSINGCDSVIVLDLEVIEPTGRLTGDSIFSCTDTIMDLFYDGEPLSALDFIQWSNVEGDFSASNTLRVQANKSGTYMVTVSKNGCVKTFTRRIINSVDIPVITARGTLLTCSQRQRRIRATSSINPATFVWRFQGSIFSTMQNPFVTQGGTYEVTVTDTAGCLNRATVMVTLDTTSSESVVIGGSLKCAVDSFQIDLRTRNGSSYLWSGPGGFTSTDQDPWVFVPGTYTVIVSLPNGCMDTVSTSVTNDVVPIDFNFTNDTIDCNSPSASLKIESSIAGTNFRWISPSDDTIFGANPSVAEAGFYTLTATTIDGCMRDTLIEVKIDTLTPVISIFGDLELTCDRQALNILAQAVPQDAVISWVYPDNRVVISDQINTRLGGIYQVIAERPNGCRTVKSITVSYAADLPNPMTLVDSFNCSTDTVSLRSTQNLNYSFEWTDLTTVLSSSYKVQVTDTGWYYLDVKDPTNCSAFYAYYVPIKLDHPTTTISGPDQITCIDSVIRLSPVNGTNVRSFLWTKDGQHFSADSSILVRSGGQYDVIVEFSSLCSDTLTKQILIDTLKPKISILPFDSLDCLVQILDLAVEADADYDYLWTLNDNPLVSDSVIAVSTPGSYVLTTASKTNDCVRMDTLILKQDTIKPIIDIKGSEINCATGKTEISVSSDIPNVDIEWIGPGGFTADIANPLVNDTGIYRVIVTAGTGCFSTDTTYLRGNFAAPGVEGLGGSLSCKDSSTVIVANSNTPGTQMSWFGIGGFVEHDSIATVRDTGLYVVVATGVNGCTSKDTVYVDDDPEYPEGRLDLEVWTCRSASVKATASSDVVTDSFKWTLPNGQTLSGANVQIPVLDSVYLEIEGLNGCITRIDTVIPTDTITPNGYISTNDIYICEHTEVRLDAHFLDTMSTYDYLWSTTDGEILNNEDKQQVTVNALGEYFMELTNQRNGCKDTSSYILSESESTFRSADIAIQDYNCLTNYNGSISIDGITGGFGNVTVSIDQEPYVGQRFYEHLLPGSYTISLRDSFGCVLDTIVEVLDREDYQFFIPTDTLIILGDVLTIEPVLSEFIDRDDMTIQWQPSDDIQCDDCLDLSVRPLNNKTYCLTIRNSTGCTVTQCIEVKVEPLNHVMIPQAFTPNGDQNNDRLVIGFSPDLESIESFKIFDRWGNLVFQKSNVTASEMVGWDGRFNGSVLSPQVLVYHLRYKLINGTVYNQVGDITILR